MTQDVQSKVSKIEQEVGEKIKNFQLELGLPNLENYEPPQYLSWTTRQLKESSVEELSLAQASLQQYALYIQRQSNSLRGLQRYLENKHEILTAHFLVQLQDTQYGWNEKMQIARYHSPTQQEIHEHLRDIRAKVDSLYDLSGKIEKVAQSYHDYKFVKIKKDKQDD